LSGLSRLTDLDEPRKPRTGKLVALDERAEPRSAVLFNNKPLSVSPAQAGHKAVCIFCSVTTDEVISGACADKIRAEVVEHKIWEEKGGH
jgi:hypothetical protein